MIGDFQVLGEVIVVEEDEEVEVVVGWVMVHRIGMVLITTVTRIQKIDTTTTEEIPNPIYPPAKKTTKP